MNTLTDEQIIEIRDRHLPSQGASFDCLAFARAIESELLQDTLHKMRNVAERGVPVGSLGLPQFFMLQYKRRDGNQHNCLVYMRDNLLDGIYTTVDYDISEEAAKVLTDALNKTLEDFRKVYGFS